MKNINLSDDRYLAFLKRMRDLIASGAELKYEDSEEIGNKYTHCSWGMCCGDKSGWPDPQDYLWPDQPDRVDIKYSTKRQCCPLSRNQTESSGCFYSCMIFKPNGEKPTREQAIKLYDDKIKEVEKFINKK